jgi:hypothetical protein
MFSYRENKMTVAEVQLIPQEGVMQQRKKLFPTREN